jgi:hypothetical protein
MTRFENTTADAREGIIFIPDISGFTKFVHDTDIKLGREIAAALLSSILHTNILNLKVSEIEGDAILFYRYGAPPTLKALMDQYERMLIAFKKKLREFNGHRRLSGLELSLKLIVHLGSIAEYRLYGFKKLYGEAIIEAHRLLKNDIPSHNYVLVTKDFFDKTGSHYEAEEMILPKWIKKQMTVPTRNSAGDLSFTCFLYDTEILKANVLQQRDNEFPDNP